MNVKIHTPKSLKMGSGMATLKDEPFPDTYFTFPVKQLSK